MNQQIRTEQEKQIDSGPFARLVKLSIATELCTRTFIAEG